MAEKKKKHLLFTTATLNVLEQRNLTVTDGIDALTLIIVTNDINKAFNYESLKTEKKFYQRQIKKTKKELEDLEFKYNDVLEQMQEIETEIEDFNIVETENFKKALESANLLLAIPEAKYKYKKNARIEKIKLQEIIDIAEENNVPADVLLSHLDENLIRKYIKYGEFLNLGGTSLQNK